MSNNNSNLRSRTYAELVRASRPGLLVRSALPETLNLMAAGEDVKETVMTIPFLRACITNMIADLERKSISDGNNRRALVKPQAPWKLFTSYELGVPLVSDDYNRPIPLVESFTDDQIEVYWAGVEEATAPFPLISQLQTMKEGWGDQGSTEVPMTADKATARERFSTSQITRNPLKLPQIELETRISYP